MREVKQTRHDLFSAPSPRLLHGFQSVMLILVAILASTATANAQSDQVILFSACLNGLQADINGVAIPGASVTSINWNWGDGTSSTGFFPQSHVYSSGGSHAVQVTANYNDGSFASTSQTFTLTSGQTSPNCVSLTVTSPQNGSTTYQSSVGSGIVIPTATWITPPDTGNVTLNLDDADDLIVGANPNNGYSFLNWNVDNVTGPGGSTIPSNVSPVDVVVPSSGSASIGADFSQTAPSSCPAAPPPLEQTIPLIPGGNPNGSWMWDTIHPYWLSGPAPPGTGSYYPLIPNSYLQLTGDLWNLAGNAGGGLPSSVTATATMSYSSYLATSVSVSDASRQFLFNIVGYPNLTYGYSPGSVTTTPEITSLPLPIPVSSFPNLWSMTNYSLGSLSQAPPSINLAYDIWITKSCQPNAIFNNDLELMIWPYWRNDVPIGLPIGGVYSIPTWINGSLVSATWVAYVGHKMPGVLRWPNSATTVSFFLLSPLPATQAYVGININYMIEDLTNVLTTPYVNLLLGSNWTQSEIEAYYVNNISFGSEFGVWNGPLQESYNFSVLNYCFVVDPNNAGPSACP